MSKLVPATRCFESEPCGFADGISAQACQATLAAAYDVYTNDARELADTSRCPLAVTRWVIHKTPPEALRALLESGPDEEPRTQ